MGVVSPGRPHSGQVELLSALRRRIPPVRAFELAVVLPVLLGLGILFAQQGIQGISDGTGVFGFLFWAGVIALVELLPIPIWRDLQVGPGFPLFTAAAFIHIPVVAAAIAFVGASDPREFKGEVRPLRAVFNRSQLALAVFASSVTFHALGGIVSDWVPQLLWAAPAAVLSFHVVNIALVSVALGLTYSLPMSDVLRRLKIGNAFEYFVSYLGLGLLGVLLARLYDFVGWWAVAAFVLPLLLARQMFFRTRALEDATQELKDREVVLRALSNRMAEERADERKAIAGYLHDDLAQVLYRMALSLDISEKQIEKGNADKAREELLSLRTSRDRAMELVRALIRDLHRNPIGREGLAEALTSYAAEIEKETRVRMQTRLREIPMAPPVQLLCYHVAREAVSNAIKHAQASTITISLDETPDGARLSIKDDGLGFDSDAGEPEGHYGLTMMKERAQVAGGSFRIESSVGNGTTVIAEFPTSWMVEESPAPEGTSAPAEPAPASQR